MKINNPSVILGAVIGDCLGVFAESKNCNYEPLLKWDGKTYLGSEYHGLKPGQGSDDSVFTIALAQSLIENNGFNIDDIALRYVDAIESGRAKGYGKTCYQAVQNLKNGIHWSLSGIDSYGSGVIMRIAPLAVYYRDDWKALQVAVTIDNNMTHSSNESLNGALVLANMIFNILNGKETQEIIENAISDGSEQIRFKETKLSSKLKILPELLKSEARPSDVLKVIGTRARVQDIIPSVIYCFAKFDNYKDGLSSIIRNAGDSDTSASILGALYGAKYGLSHFSDYHVQNVEDSAKLIALDSQLFSRDNSKIF